jgi:hypothetical protein
MQIEPGSVGFKNKMHGQIRRIGSCSPESIVSHDRKGCNFATLSQKREWRKKFVQGWVFEWFSNSDLGGTFCGNLSQVKLSQNNRSEIWSVGQIFEGENGVNLAKVVTRMCSINDEEEEVYEALVTAVQNQTRKRFKRGI